MESIRIQNGQTTPIEVIAETAGGVPVIGLSNVLLGIRRISDDQWLDFADNVFKASGWTTRQKVMTEIDATKDAGKYKYSFDSTGFSDDTYQFRAENVTAFNFPQFGEVIVGDYVDDISVAKRILQHKLTIDPATSKMISWDATGDNVVESWPMTDKDGLAIVLTGTHAANRGVPT